MLCKSKSSLFSFLMILPLKDSRTYTIIVFLRRWWGWGWCWFLPVHHNLTSHHPFHLCCLNITIFWQILMGFEYLKKSEALSDPTLTPIEAAPSTLQSLFFQHYNVSFVLFINLTILNYNPNPCLHPPILLASLFPKAGSHSCIEGYSDA